MACSAGGEWTELWPAPLFWSGPDKTGVLVGVHGAWAGNFLLPLKPQRENSH